MSSISLTFQKCLPLCEAGDREAWAYLLRNYASIAFRVLDFYLPSFRGDEQRRFWQEALAALTANQYERLRTFDHLSEREFLMDLRTFLLERGAERLGTSPEPPGAPKLTPDALTALLHSLPFAHQEVVFLKLAGYSDATTEKIAGVPPSIAGKALENLAVQYAPILRHDGDSCPWPAQWLGLIRQAHASRTPECVARRLLVRIFDGQISWYDKSPTEAHVSRCANCMESWIALREINFLRKVATPLPPAEVDELLSGLSFSAPAERGSFLRRWFGS